MIVPKLFKREKTGVVPSTVSSYGEVTSLGT